MDLMDIVPNFKLGIWNAWIFMIIALVWIISWQFGMVEEERILLEKYGEAYQQYMNRTPRWIGFPNKR